MCYKCLVHPFEFKTWAALINEPLAHLFMDELRELNPTLEGYAGMCEKVLIARNIDIIKDDFRTLLVSGRDEGVNARWCPFYL